jgi:hypothetical protein
MDKSPDRMLATHHHFFDGSCALIAADGWAVRGAKQAILNSTDNHWGCLKWSMLTW